MSAAEVFIEQGEDPGIDPALGSSGGRVENGVGDRGPTAAPTPPALDGGVLEGLR